MTEVEMRETPNNPAFNGYCTEFWSGGILLAVARKASPAADALEQLFWTRGAVTRTVESQNREGEWVLRKFGSGEAFQRPEAISA